MSPNEIECRIRNVERLALLLVQSLDMMFPNHPDIEPLHRAGRELLESCDAMSGLEPSAMETATQLGESDEWESFLEAETNGMML